jgi:tetratricopeptide (TPR) repeat protein
MYSLKNKLLLALLVNCFLNCANAQVNFVFDKRFVECEDKWVAFQKDKDGAYAFGFIYIDQMAGLTLNYESSFTIGDDGKLIRKPVLDSLMASYKIRLQNNNVKVALIPESKFSELKIAASPEWLANYKTGIGTAKRLQRWGYYYNDWGMSGKALEYLEPGYKMAPDYKGMAVELAFAYNVLEKFEEAIPVLNKAIDLTPDDWYLYKELSYAQLKTDKLDDAGQSAMKGIGYAKETQMKAEMAYNIAYSYFEKKDKESFSKWATETRKWAAKDGQFYKGIENMESKMKE